MLVGTIAENIQDSISNTTLLASFTGGQNLLRVCQLIQLAGTEGVRPVRQVLFCERRQQ